jgi:8-oxo-dGTP pyrophosphatase MutT (NUDIX family)
MLIRGSYRTIDLLKIMIGISDKEKQDIIFMLKDKNEIEKRFSDTYSDVIGFEDEAHDNDYLYAKKRFFASIRHIKRLLNNPVAHDTEWTFPKGRLINRETGIDCAIREFNEETGINIRENYETVHRFYCDYFSNIFRGSNSKIYETRLWLYIFRSEIEADNIVDNSDGEIKHRVWVSTAEALSLLSASNRNFILEALKQIRNVY